MFGCRGQKGQREVETRSFGATTRELLALRDWLVEQGVQVVGMEATGSYWKPVYYVLEDALECWLLNARHLRNVPGRKTDVAHAAWIAHVDEALSRLEEIRDSSPEHVYRGLAEIVPMISGDQLTDWLDLAHRKLMSPESSIYRAMAWAGLAHRWGGFDDRSRWRALSVWAERQRYHDRTDVLVDLLCYAPALLALGDPETSNRLIARLGLETAI